MKLPALGLALTAALGGTARPQEVPATPEPPAFPAQVEQVTVDVVVTDGKGQPVTDLKRENLEVYEDGVRQPIASFDLFQVPAAPPAVPAAEAPAPPRSSRLSTNTEPQQQRGRSFVIVFDDVHLGPRGAQQAKAAIAEFLKNNAPWMDFFPCPPGAGEEERISFIWSMLSAFGSLSHFLGDWRFSVGSSAMTFSMRRYLQSPLIEEIKRHMLDVEYPLSFKVSRKSMICGLVQVENVLPRD